jgi:hypothetical protein
MIMKNGGFIIFLAIFLLSSCSPEKYSGATFPSTPAIESSSTIEITITPTKPTRPPTSPSGDAGQFQYTESDCLGNMPEIRICAAGKAYESARKLDALLVELDNQFPNGAWEIAFNRLLLSQEKWESYKLPYCEIDSQDSIGGSEHGIVINNCIEAQNEERIEKLIWAACFVTEGFSRCKQTKSGGEEPIITAIPMVTSTP